MDPFVLGLMCMSGAVAAVNAVTDVALWPLTATMCPPGHKMTLDHGCDGRADPDSAGGVGRCLALLCCVLSAGALWWRIDGTATIIFAVTCCLVSSCAQVLPPPGRAVSRSWSFV